MERNSKFSGIIRLIQQASAPIAIDNVFEDSEGTIWASTDVAGLNKFNRQKETFTVYKNIPGDSTSLHCNRVFKITELKALKGVLWLTTNDGISRFDTKSGKFTKLNLGSHAGFFESNSEPGILWVYCPNLTRYDWRNNKAEILLDPPFGIIWAVWEFPANPGVLWLGSGKGLYKYDISKGVLTDFNNHLDIFELYSPSSEPGVLYIGLWDGVLTRMVIPDSLTNDQITPENVQFYHYENKEGDLNSFTGGMVITIYESDRQPGIIWIATTQGLNKICIPQKKFVNIPIQSTNEDDIYIYSLKRSIDGKFWLGTTGGVLSLELDEKDNTQKKFTGTTPKMRIV
jgi:ligand-binding sensor domain-containing protein